MQISGLQEISLSTEVTENPSWLKNRPTTPEPENKSNALPPRFDVRSLILSLKKLGNATVLLGNANEFLGNSTGLLGNELLGNAQWEEMLMNY